MKAEKKKGSALDVLVRLLGDEKRQRISIPIFAVLLSIVAGSLVIFAIGKNPVETYVGFLQGSGILPKARYAGGMNQLTDFLSFLDILAPMILAALAVATAQKAGLFNIGISGQMLAAGFTATVLVGYSELPALVAKPLVVLIAGVVGALCGGIVGFLKHRFNINEVVSTIMFNYIIQFITSFLISTYWINPVSRQSNYITPEASLTLKSVRMAGLKMDIPFGIVIALVAVFVVAFLVDKTILGYEIKAVGFNKEAARYAGIRVGRTIVVTMMISGALAGLAGATYYLGYLQSMQPRVLASLGYDSIATALLGNSNSFGIVAASILVSALSKGSTYMSSRAGVVKEISGVITGLILLFSATGAFIRYLVDRRLREMEDEETKKTTAKGGETHD